MPVPIQSSAGCRLTFVKGATTTVGDACPAAGNAEVTSPAPATTIASTPTRRQAAPGATRDRYGPNRCPGTRDVVSYMQSSSPEASPFGAPSVQPSPVTKACSAAKVQSRGPGIVALRLRFPLDQPGRRLRRATAQTLGSPW